MRSMFCLSLSLLLSLARLAGAAPLTVAACFEQAAQHNRQLELARYDVDLSRDDTAVARSAYLPRIDVEAGYTRQNEARALRFGGAAVPVEEDRYRYGSASLTQSLYTFGRTGARYGRAQRLAAAAGHAYRATRQEVFLQVVTAYYGVLEAQQVLSTAAAEVAQREDHLRVARDFLAAGTTTRADLLQAEVELAASKLQHLSARNALSNRWLALNLLIGQEAGFRAELVGGEAPERAPADPGLELALARRPELLAAAEHIEIAELARREARAGYAPELFARVAADYVENDKSAENTILSAVIGFRINLFDGLATTAQQRKAVTAGAQARAALARWRDAVGLEYRTACNDRAVALERIETATAAVEQALENLRITRERYQAMVGTATEVVDAQTLLTRTKNDRSRALFDYHVAAARLEKAAGLLGVAAGDTPAPAQPRSSP